MIVGEKNNVLIHYLTVKASSINKNTNCIYAIFLYNYIRIKGIEFNTFYCLYFHPIQVKSSLGFDIFN